MSEHELVEVTVALQCRQLVPASDLARAGIPLPVEQAAGESCLPKTSCHTFEAVTGSSVKLLTGLKARDGVSYDISLTVAGLVGLGSPGSLDAQKGSSNSQSHVLHPTDFPEGDFETPMKVKEEWGQGLVSLEETHKPLPRIRQKKRQSSNQRNTSNEPSVKGSIRKPKRPARPVARANLRDQGENTDGVSRPDTNAELQMQKDASCTRRLSAGDTTTSNKTPPKPPPVRPASARDEQSIGASSRLPSANASATKETGKVARPVTRAIAEKEQALDLVQDVTLDILPVARPVTRASAKKK